MALTFSVYQAIQNSLAYFDLSARSLVRVAGADRAKFLHSFCTNDVKVLQPGQGCEAFVCNAKGRVLAHCTLFAELQEIWLDTVPNAGDALIQHLDRYVIREDVTFTNVSHQFAQLYLAGPSAPAVLATLTSGAEPCPPGEIPGIVSSLEQLPIPGGQYWSATPWGELWIRCVDWLGVRGYLLVVDAARLPTLKTQLTEQSAVGGTDDDWESCRIEAGWPTYGADISEENLPQEVARNARCISFTKGCYLGQEPIARLDALGHTNRELRRLAWTQTVHPAAGTELHDVASGELVGRLTSAAPHPSGSGGCGLGYLKTRWTTPGTQVRLGKPESGITASVR